MIHGFGPGFFQTGAVVAFGGPPMVSVSPVGWGSPSAAPVGAVDTPPPWARPLGRNAIYCRGRVKNPSPYLPEPISTSCILLPRFPKGESSTGTAPY
jgi:hypothetical protein